MAPRAYISGDKDRPYPYSDRFLYRSSIESVFFLYYNHVSRTIHSLPAEKNINKEDKRIRSAKPYYLICGSISIAVGSSTIAMPSSQQKKNTYPREHSVQEDKRPSIR